MDSVQSCIGTDAGAIIVRCYEVAGAEFTPFSQRQWMANKIPAKTMTRIPLTNFRAERNFALEIWFSRSASYNLRRSASDRLSAAFRPVVPEGATPGPNG